MRSSTSGRMSSPIPRERSGLVALPVVVLAVRVIAMIVRTTRSGAQDGPRDQARRARLDDRAKEPGDGEVKGNGHHYKSRFITRAALRQVIFSKAASGMAFCCFNSRK